MRSLQEYHFNATLARFKQLIPKEKKIIRLDFNATLARFKLALWKELLEACELNFNATLARFKPL